MSTHRKGLNQAQLTERTQQRRNLILERVMAGDSETKLAELIGISVRSVEKHIAILQEEGKLTNLKADRLNRIKAVVKKMVLQGHKAEKIGRVVGLSQEGALHHIKALEAEGIYYGKTAEIRALTSKLERLAKLIVDAKAVEAVRFAREVLGQ